MAIKWFISEDVKGFITSAVMDSKTKEFTLNKTVFGGASEDEAWNFGTKKNAERFIAEWLDSNPQDNLLLEKVDTKKSPKPKAEEPKAETPAIKFSTDDEFDLEIRSIADKIGDATLKISGNSENSIKFAEMRIKFLKTMLGFRGNAANLIATSDIILTGKDNKQHRRNVKRGIKKALELLKEVALKFTSKPTTNSYNMLKSAINNLDLNLYSAKHLNKIVSAIAKGDKLPTVAKNKTLGDLELPINRFANSLEYLNYDEVDKIEDEKEHTEKFEALRSNIKLATALLKEISDNKKKKMDDKTWNVTEAVTEALTPKK